jgi:hypothetical protein
MRIIRPICWGIGQHFFLRDRFGKSPVKCYVEPKLAAREHFEILHSCCPVPIRSLKLATMSLCHFFTLGYYEHLPWSHQVGLKSPCQTTVRICAVQVRYCTSHFREKNMDVMPSEVLQVLSTWETSRGLPGCFRYDAFGKHILTVFDS